MLKLDFKTSLPHIALAVTQLLFSGWHVLSTISLKDGADPLIFSMYRELLGCIFMITYVLLIEKSKLCIKSEHWLRFLLMGIFSFANVVGTIYSLHFIPPTLYSLFQPIIPCFSTALSIIMQIEPFTIYKLFGILIAISGAILVESGKYFDNPSLGDNILLFGTLLVIVQCISVSCLIVIQKTMLEYYPPGMLTFSYYSLGTIFTILLVIFRFEQYNVSTLTLDNNWIIWCTLLYATIFTTFIAYNIYSWAGKILPVSITTIYSTIQPITTCFLSYLIFQETLSYRDILGGLLVIFGLFITMCGRTKEISSTTISTKSNDSDIIIQNKNVKNIKNSQNVYNPVNTPNGNHDYGMIGDDDELESNYDNASVHNQHHGNTDNYFNQPLKSKRTLTLTSSHSNNNRSYMNNTRDTYDYDDDGNEYDKENDLNSEYNNSTSYSSIITNIKKILTSNDKSPQKDHILLPKKDKS